MTGCLVQINTKSGWYGGEYQVFKLTEGLTALGFETLLLANGDGDLYRRATEAGLPARPLPRTACVPWLPAGLGRIRRLLDGCTPGLFHVHDSRALTLGLWLAGRRPVILSRRVPTPIRVNPLSRWRYSPRRIAVIGVSETVSRVLTDGGYPATRLFVVPSGSDLDEVDRAVPDGSLRGLAGGRLCVGGVGALTRKKNWAMLVRTASRVKQRGLDVRWFVAGDGPERASLGKLAADLGVAEEVRFVGYRTDVNAFTKGLDLLFHPSRAEGFCGAVRTAMLAGVPVVAAAVDGTLEVVDSHALTVPLDDDDRAADAVARLARDGGLRARLGAQARIYGRAHFDIRATVTGTVDVYRAVLGDTRA